MKRLLLVSSIKKSSEVLKDLILENDSFKIDCAPTAATARLHLSKEHSVVVINTPLGDEFGGDLAMECLSHNCGVILLVKEENSNAIFQSLGEAGVSVVPKPLNRSFFLQSLKLALSVHSRIGELSEKNKILENQLDEIRLVDRAKFALIQYVKMTEPQAHRYIEKHAMDMRTSKRDVALSILKAYET